ncbi:MAG: hypothetical protein GTO29_13540 [Candidatus Latescibacteria bacterium]|nr:hypothetical protein [Candidatus Latescibacterota bacterium]NIO57275.1 hypothetical protein [Candidatus Latescibacterota bacterium]
MEKSRKGPRKGDPNIKLVEVWKAQGETEAQIIRSVLEGDGIESMLSGESVRLTHGITVDGLAEVKILVREEDETRAREVIAAFVENKD